MGDSPKCRFPVDRQRAAVRGLWRGGGSILLAGLTWLIGGRLDWPLMWRTDAASCVALACVVACLAAPTIGLAASALRWLLLAAWPGAAEIAWCASEVLIRLGPFGTARLDRGRLRVTDLPDDFAELTEWDDRLPRLAHPNYGPDVLETVLRFCAVDPTGLRRRIVDLQLIPSGVSEPPRPPSAAANDPLKAQLKALAARHRKSGRPSSP